MKVINQRLVLWTWAAAIFVLVSPHIRNKLSRHHLRAGDGGPAIQAVIEDPSSIAVDSAGNLFIYEATDDLPPAIRKVAAGTGTVTTLMLGCENSWPPQKGDCLGPVSQLLVQGNSRLLLLEFTKNRLRSFDLRSKKLSLAAGNGTNKFTGDSGPAVAAGITWARCAATDQAGNIFVCDRNRIRRIDSQTKRISSVAGTGEAGFSGDGGPALKTQFDFLTSIALNAAGDIFVTDGSSGRIRKIDAKTQIIETIAGTGRGGRFGFEVVDGPALQADLHDLGSLTLDRGGNLLFSNDASRICKIDLRSGALSTVAGRGALGSDGDGGPATAAHIEAWAIALDPNGNLYFADGERNQIRRVDARSGIVSTFAGNGLPHRVPRLPIL